MIRINEVSKFYGRKPALERVSLELPPGEIVGLFGENGAGKTTLMKCILGLVHYSGEITLDGQPVTRRNMRACLLRPASIPSFPSFRRWRTVNFTRSIFPASPPSGSRA